MKALLRIALMMCLLFFCEHASASGVVQKQQQQKLNIRRHAEIQAKMQMQTQLQMQAQMQMQMEPEVMVPTESLQELTHQQLLVEQDNQGAPDEEMDFDALWEELARSSEVWKRIVDKQIKGLIVQTYIDWYREQGIAINEPVIDYMLSIDQLALHDSELFGQPFARLLMMVAVMEYDFDNGMDKDELARQVLGEEFYHINRQRLGLNQGEIKAP